MAVKTFPIESDFYFRRDTAATSTTNISHFLRKRGGPGRPKFYSFLWRKAGPRTTFFISSEKARERKRQQETEKDSKTATDSRRQQETARDSKRQQETARESKRQHGPR